MIVGQNLSSKERPMSSRLLMSVDDGDDDKKNSVRIVMSTKTLYKQAILKDISRFDFF